MLLGDFILVEDLSRTSQRTDRTSCQAHRIQSGESLAGRNTLRVW